MRRINMVRIGIVLAGVLLLVYALYVRETAGTREGFSTIGIILIIIGILTFFFGEAEEEKIEQEE